MWGQFHNSTAKNSHGRGLYFWVTKQSSINTLQTLQEQLVPISSRNSPCLYSHQALPLKLL